MPCPTSAYHHRGAEKMGERQTWHTYIPYTDRIDYLGGVMNNLPYVMAVEKLAGIEVPDRAKVIRVMMCELFRIISHLVWYRDLRPGRGRSCRRSSTCSTTASVSSTSSRRSAARACIPNWFRIGGVAQDLPRGLGPAGAGISGLPAAAARWNTTAMVHAEPAFSRRRTQGVGAYTTQEAIEWGVTGPGLRACGLEWDFRKKRPYSGYEQFEFDIPTGQHGDCYDRAWVRVEEMRQSLRIIGQCVDNMPAGDYKSRPPAGHARRSRSGPCTTSKR